MNLSDVKIESKRPMNTYISMLRGINVAGKKRIKMDELKALYESLGFKNVKTYIQSGNVVFQCSDSNASKLVKKIGEEIKQSFGLTVTVVIRTKEEYKQVIKRNPFQDKDLSKLHITFLSESVENPPIKRLEMAKSGMEEFDLSGKEIYLFCPNGYGRTKLTNNFFEKQLNISATTRNWRTVNALSAMAE